MSGVGGGRLLLVRHAMPLVDPRVPGELWQLGVEGREAARRLRSRIAEPAYYVASDEFKALQTLHEIADPAPVAVDAGFREITRPHIWSTGYRDRARAYVAGVCHDGWEPHEQVAARFDAAVTRHAAVAGGQLLVIGTHGLAPTLWLRSRALLAEPAQFWEDLRFPDLIAVDLTAGSAARLAS